MSVTTTDNARVTTVRHLLADYELHHSQPSDEEAAPAPAPDAHPAPADTVNPPDWQDQYRRVPPYRPTQDQYDESRTTANNGIEHNFIRVMFTGVGWVAATAQFWRNTGGRINPDIFKYKIGGEW